MIRVLKETGWMENNHPIREVKYTFDYGTDKTVSALIADHNSNCQKNDWVKIVRNNLLELSSDIKEEDEDMSYSFNVTAPELQIDLQLIANDLTKQNPIAYVGVDNEEWFGYFIVHHMLAIKDAAIFDSNYRHGEYMWDGTLVIKCKEKHTFKQWLSHFKKVDKASWGRDHRNPALVNVSFPSLR